ncbi:cupin domain-containing protein [Nocardioides gilvus]|uniref:cupin domain-containing protein n=1 Tax=Nocardioides gilvus TaxID=1735589 RepID=UPI0013A53979|nr:hypothetical protein [Nocardioides gilvus]
MTAGAQATVVDGAAMRWVNGAEVYETMEPAFRDNIGQDREAALTLLRRYNARCLWKDDTTSRRIDHIRADPGYVDLSEAYHDSVEECLVLGGAVELTAEGDFEAGDYFWRPPGWVHSASSPQGFEAILMMEGEDSTEGSDRVSRVVRPDEDAGEHVSQADQLGPRGYVRRAESRFMPWRDHDDHGTRLGGGATAKVLSLNADTGAETVLVQVPAGWSSLPERSERERFIINTSGALLVDDQELAEPSLVRVPAGVVAPRLHAPGGAELMVKTGPPADPTAQ